MRNLNIHEQAHSKLGKAGKKALSKMKKEHNGPDGHRIPEKFGTIAKKVGTKVAGQELRFEGPTGKLIYGGPGTDAFSGAFREGQPVKVIGGNKVKFTPEGYVQDDDFIVVEDND